MFETLPLWFHHEVVQIKKSYYNSNEEVNVWLHKKNRTKQNALAQMKQ